MQSSLIERLGFVAWITLGKILSHETTAISGRDLPQSLRDKPVDRLCAAASHGAGVAIYRDLTLDEPPCERVIA
jgi:hypothetical protein